MLFRSVRRIDPACRPPRSQPIPYKPGKVVVQMVVYLPSPLTQKSVLASFLKGGSEDATPFFDFLGFVGRLLPSRLRLRRNGRRLPLDGLFEALG